MFGSYSQRKHCTVVVLSQRDEWMRVAGVGAWHGWRHSCCVQGNNLFAKIGSEQCPGRRPALALDQATQGQNSLSAMGSPGHAGTFHALRSEEHTSELQSRLHLVCR